MREHPYIALMERFADRVWGQRDAGSLEELCTPDMLVHGFGPQPLVGPAAFRDQVFASFCKTCRTSTLTYQEAVIEGDRLALRGTFRLVLHDGSEVSIEGAGFVRVRDGRIAEAWNFWDFLSLLQQTGDIAETTMPTALERLAALQR